MKDTKKADAGVRHPEGGAVKADRPSLCPGWVQRGFKPNQRAVEQHVETGISSTSHTPQLRTTWVIGGLLSGPAVQAAAIAGPGPGPVLVGMALAWGPGASCRSGRQLGGPRVCGWPTRSRLGALQGHPGLLCLLFNQVFLWDMQRESGPRGPCLALPSPALICICSALTWAPDPATRPAPGLAFTELTS